MGAVTHSGYEFAAILQRDVEVDFLIQKLRDAEVRTVLEIGTFFGGLAARLAAEGFEVTTADSYNNPKEWESPSFVAMFPGAAQRIRFILGDTHAQSVIDVIKASRYDAVILDGDHTLRAHQDWLAYAPLADKLVLIHDIEEYWRANWRDPEWWPMRMWNYIAMDTTLEVEEHISDAKGNWGCVFVPNDQPEWWKVDLATVLLSEPTGKIELEDEE